MNPVIMAGFFVYGFKIINSISGLKQIDEVHFD